MSVVRGQRAPRLRGDVGGPSGNRALRRDV